MPHIIEPTSDLGFKKILASENHKTITQGFIADFFGLTVKLEDIHIVNPYSIKAYEETTSRGGKKAQKRLRQTLRDITLTVDTVDISVELQVRKEPHFVTRAFYYLTDRYTSHYNEPPATRHDRYAALRPAWALNILTKPVLPCTHPYHMFTLYDPTIGEPLTPQLARFGFFELTKPNPTEQHARWRDFLQTGVDQQTDPPYLKEAARIIKYVNLSRQERDMDKLLRKALDIEQSRLTGARDDGIKVGKKRGIKVGIKRGIKQGDAQGFTRGDAQGFTRGDAQGFTRGHEQGAHEVRLANARAALAMGFSPGDVATFTGLDAATVHQLASEVHTSTAGA